MGPWRAQAQATAAAVRTDSLRKVNFIQSGRYTRVVYTLNDEPLTDAILKKVLAKYPESAAELHKYRV